jgi:hypothetical protein
MKPKINVLQKEYTGTEIILFLTSLLLPIFTLVLGTIYFNENPQVWDTYKEHKLTILFILIAISSYWFINLMLMECSFMGQRNVNSLSEHTTHALKLKVDTYLKAIQHTSSLPADANIMIYTRTAYILKDAPLNRHHTRHLQNIIREELSPFFSKFKIKLMMRMGIEIPLNTTHPSSHQIFKMAALQTKVLPTQFLTLGV